jgi:hypothetical protein
MTKTNGKHHDLEERTFQFAKKVALYLKKLPRDIVNFNNINKEY